MSQPSPPSNTAIVGPMTTASVARVSDGYLTKLRTSLGLSEEEWPEELIRHLLEEGNRNQLCNARVCQGFDSMKRVADAMNDAKAMIADTSYKPLVRVEVMKAMALLSDAWINADERISALINEAAPTEKRKPMNAPPQMAVQINVPGKDAQVSIKK